MLIVGLSCYRLPIWESLSLLWVLLAEVAFQLLHLRLQSLLSRHLLLVRAFFLLSFPFESASHAHQSEVLRTFWHVWWFSISFCRICRLPFAGIYWTDTLTALPSTLSTAPWYLQVFQGPIRWLLLCDRVLLAWWLPEANRSFHCLTNSRFLSWEGYLLMSRPMSNFLNR